MARQLDLHTTTAVRDLVHGLVEDGYAARDLLEGSGLRLDDIQDDQASAPVPAIARVFERAAELTGDTEIGMQRGQTRDMRTAGLLSYVGLSTPTVADMLHNMARFRQIFSRSLDIDVSLMDSTGGISWSFDVDDQVSRRQWVEFQAAQIIGNLRRYTGERIQPLSLAFRHSRNFNIGAFRDFFGTTPRWGGALNEIRFRSEDLSLPLSSADPHLHSYLVHHFEQVLADMPTPVLPIQSRVEQAIAERLASGQVSARSVAAELGLSERTLARRLSEAGLSYQDILSRLREGLATQYLRAGRLSVSEVAYLLGYSDVSSFSSAYRRWTGTAPGSVRATD